jgi:hypothetical protein
MPDLPTAPTGRDVGLGNRPIGPPPPNIIETEVKGDLSLYDPGQEKVLVLNGTATDVWLLCDGGQTGGRIVELVAAAHGQEAATVRTDVESTIRQFIEEGFLPTP